MSKKKLSIHPALVKDSPLFTFVEVPSMYPGFFDVMYAGRRIAILNGTSAPLEWTAPNGSNIPVSVVDSLEQMVIKWITDTPNYEKHLAA